MYSIGIGLLISVLIIIFMVIRANQGKLQAVFVKSFWTVLIMIVVSFIFASILTRQVPLLEVELNAKTLVSLHETNGYQGSFVIGSGTFASGRYYHVMVRNDDMDNSVSPHRIKVSSSVRIVESEDLNKSGSWVQLYQIYQKDHWLYHWSMASGRRFLGDKLVVPKGTIKIYWAVNDE